MITVSKEQFFAYVNPRDIVLRCEREFTVWQTRGQVEIGRTTPGYMCEGPASYRLTESAYAELMR